VFSFNSQTRQLGYEVVLSGASRDQVAGVYLHRRTNRANGGVAPELSLHRWCEPVGAHRTDR